jgi:hypothetical protein
MPWIENKDFMDVDVLGSNKTWQKHGKTMAKSGNLAAKHHGISSGYSS